MFHLRFERDLRPLRLPALLVLAASGALVACDDSSTSPSEEERVPAIELQRLLVADAQEPTARLIALHNDQVLQTVALTGPASLVYRTHSGRYGVIQQRTANRVQFVDGGVWAHSDHAHRRTPTMLGFQLDDGLPTHENVNGGWISIFFDGSGVARWMNESDKIAGSPRVTFEVQTGGPHHGGSATLVVNNQPFLVYSPRNPAGGLPHAVEVRNSQGTVVARVDDCPSMHGNSATSGGVVFGCNNGLVLVRPSGSGVTAEKITPTGDMAGLGLRNAWTTSGASFVLGQFAALPGQPTQRVLAVINPATGSIQRLPALPEGVVDHSRAVEPGKGQIVLLGTNGSLYIYDAASRQLQRTVSGVVPPIPTSGATVHQVAVVEDLAAVASPTQGQVVLVNLATGVVIRRINVGGTPSRLTILGATRSGMYELED